MLGRTWHAGFTETEAELNTMNCGTASSPSANHYQRRDTYFLFLESERWPYGSEEQKIKVHTFLVTASVMVSIGRLAVIGIAEQE